jgi:hypothetical protein
MTHAARSLGIAVLLLLSSVFVVGVIAQETDRQHEANVYGKVVDAETGKGLHALVEIIAPDTGVVHTATTGEDGGFRFFLPAGGYVWEASAEHHHPGRGEFRVGDRIVELKIPLKPIVKEEEPPEHNVFGMVVDARTGEGIPAHVGFINPDGKALEMDTEEDGTFKVLLFPSVWVWMAGAEGYETQEGRFVMEKEPVRLKIELVPLEQEEPEEPEQKWAILYGVVQTPEGKPIPQARVVLHPMRMDEPPVEPGIPEDPNMPPTDNDKYTTSGEERTRGENEETRTITLRQFFELLKDKLDEETIKRIFHAADADGNGELNEREMNRAHELIREIMGDRDPDRPPAPDREPLHAVTNEEGMFRMRVPFGAYIILTEARGFHPNEMPIRISPRMQEHKVRIVLEPMEKEEPKKDCEGDGRVKIVFAMEDHNSDGNPEMVKFAADFDGDCIHEIVFHMTDRNSDGTPDSVEWVLDLPMQMWEFWIYKIMEFIENHHGLLWSYEEWEEFPEEWEGFMGEDGLPPDWEMIQDLINGEVKDEDMDAAGNVEKDTDDLDSGEMDPSSVSDKASSTGSETPVLEILAAAGVLALILSILIAVGLYIRKRSD